MSNILATKSSLLVKTNEGDIRFVVSKGKIEVHTNMQRKSEKIMQLTKKVKSYLVNFKDPKRDYSQRLKSCEKELASYNTNQITYLVKKFGTVGS